MTGRNILLLVFVIILLIIVDLSNEGSIIKTWLKKRKKK